MNLDLNQTVSAGTRITFRTIFSDKYQTATLLSRVPGYEDGVWCVAMDGTAQPGRGMNGWISINYLVESGRLKVL